MNDILIPLLIFSPFIFVVLFIIIYFIFVLGALILGTFLAIIEILIKLFEMLINKLK